MNSDENAFDNFCRKSTRTKRIYYGEANIPKRMKKKNKNRKKLRKSKKLQENDFISPSNENMNNQTLNLIENDKTNDTQESVTTDNNCSQAMQTDESSLSSSISNFYCTNKINLMSKFEVLQKWLNSTSTVANSESENSRNGQSSVEFSLENYAHNYDTDSERSKNDQNSQSDAGSRRGRDDHWNTEKLLRWKKQNAPSDITTISQSSIASTTNQNVKGRDAFWNSKNLLRCKNGTEMSQSSDVESSVSERRCRDDRWNASTLLRNKLTSTNVGVGGSAGTDIESSDETSTLSSIIYSSQLNGKSRLNKDRKLFERIDSFSEFAASVSEPNKSCHAKNKKPKSEKYIIPKTLKSNKPILKNDTSLTYLSLGKREHKTDTTNIIESENTLSHKSPGRNLQDKIKIFKSPKLSPYKKYKRKVGHRNVSPLRKMEIFEYNHETMSMEYVDPLEEDDFGETNKMQLLNNSLDLSQASFLNVPEIQFQNDLDNISLINMEEFQIDVPSDVLEDNIDDLQASILMQDSSNEMTSNINDISVSNLNTSLDLYKSINSVLEACNLKTLYSPSEKQTSEKSSFVTKNRKSTKKKNIPKNCQKKRAPLRKKHLDASIRDELNETMTLSQASLNRDDPLSQKQQFSYKQLNEFSENYIELTRAFENVQVFIKDVSSEFNSLQNSQDLETFVSSQISTDLNKPRKIEVIKLTDNEDNFDKKKITFDKMLSNKTLIYDGPEFERTPYEVSKDIVKRKIRKIFYDLNADIENGRKLVLNVRNYRNWSNVIVENDRLILKSGNAVKYTKINQHYKNSKNKFNLIIYLLKKIFNLLMLNASCTKREIYYQIVNFARNQKQVNAALDTIICMLDVPPWKFGLLSTGKGLVYGNLKILLADSSVLHCNIKGGSLIPTKVYQDIVKLETNAKFILIVEKDSIFQKLLDEDIPNKLQRPFIMITAKGYADTNTRLFIKILWMCLSIPTFILVDGDPHGIEIMLSYRFGALNSCYLSKELALPNIRWIGVHPTEIQVLNIKSTHLTSKEIAKTKTLLTRPYIKSNQLIKQELESLLKNRKKAEIEGLIKCNNFLSNFYLPNKLQTKDFI